MYQRNNFFHRQRKKITVDESTIYQVVKEVGKTEKDPNRELYKMIVKITKLLKVTMNEKQINIFIQKITSSFTS